MVRKRKPVIDTFHKWLDAYTAYMLVIVAAFPRRALELLKYQQIISRAESKFKGLAWLAYDEQFCRYAASDLTRPWDLVDLELWMVTAIMARNNVLLLSRHQRPKVSTPINVAELQRELCTHPDRNFVNSLLSALT